MPSGVTTILGLTIPTVGGDANIWGTELNTNLGIIDLTGAASIVNVSSNYTATNAKSILTLIRVTTSGLTINVTLPDPGTNMGKCYAIKKLDAGLGIVNIIGTVDLQTSWQLSNQFQVVILCSMGTAYDIISGG